MSHNFIPGVPYGSNRRKKEILLEQLQLKGIGVVPLPDISHNSLTKAKHLHVYVNAEALTLLLWHINLTPMEKAIDCVKL